LRFLLTDHGDFWQNAARGYSLRATQGKLDLDEIEKAYSLGSFSLPLQSSHITKPAGRKEKNYDDISQTLQALFNLKTRNSLAFMARSPSHPTFAGLLCVFATSAGAN
jgi:hypothetical protein